MEEEGKDKFEGPVRGRNYKVESTFCQNAFEDLTEQLLNEKREEEEEFHAVKKNVRQTSYVWKTLRIFLMFHLYKSTSSAWSGQNRRLSRNCKQSTAFIGKQLTNMGSESELREVSNLP